MIFWHSCSLTARQETAFTAKNLCSSEASRHNARPLRPGKHLRALFLSSLPAVRKSGWRINRSIWIVGLALTASLWPHWLFNIWLRCYVFRFMWTFSSYRSFPVVDLLPSATVGRFCSVWNMILISFTRLNFRVTEKKKREKMCPFYSKHTYTCKKWTNKYLLFLFTSNVYMIDFI